MNEDITFYKYKDNRWEIIWNGDFDITVDDTIELQKIQESDNMQALINLINPWIIKIRKNGTIASLGKLPINLIEKVVADAPPFRNE